MKLSEFKTKLEGLETLDFYLSNGQKIPSHFHITEVGMTTKNFTDCGNTFRIQKTATLQLWTSVDYCHRLDPKMVVKIINSTEKMFEGQDLDIEIEYQQDTTGKFGLDFINNQFILTNTQTNCLAKNSCGLPLEKVKIKMSDLQAQIALSCSPESNCC
ncbi:DUF6428 family protein [Flavobacterium sp.]|uniref:DUF6428 family protein n=1 Tax=Flavobacterium sp. TaxID=239 RepID=UPI00286E84FC|nr:DUF6428 family protein [Flavobacterium sp.]